MRDTESPSRRLPHQAALLAGLTLVALLSTALSLGALTLALRSLESVWQDRVEALAHLHRVTAPLDRVVPLAARRGFVADVVADSVARSVTVANAFSRARQASDSAWQRYLATTLTAEEAQYVRTVSPLVDRALHAADTMVAVLHAGPSARVFHLLDSLLLPALTDVDHRLDTLVSLQSQITRQQVEAARGRHEFARLLLIASGIVTAVLILATLRSPRGTNRGGSRRTSWRR